MHAKAVALPRRQDSPAGFERLHPGALRPLGRLDVDLFAMRPGKAPPILIGARGVALSRGKIDALVQDEERDLFVRSGDYRALSKCLLEATANYLRDESIPQADRFASLQIAAAIHFERVWEAADPGSCVPIARRIAESVVALLQAGEIVPGDLFRAALHDDRPSVHATNVACYAVLLGIGRGMHGQRELVRIATGAVLHDVGKRVIPIETLHKHGRRDETERNLIESHPIVGFRELRDGGELDWPELMMVYQHHEHVDGSGYPAAVCGEEIHPWAQLLAVANVFDALTAEQMRRPPLTPREALAELARQAGSHFDKETTACWIQIMANV